MLSQFNGPNKATMWIDPAEVVMIADHPNMVGCFAFGIRGGISGMGKGNAKEFAAWCMYQSEQQRADKRENEHVEFLRRTESYADVVKKFLPGPPPMPSCSSCQDVPIVPPFKFDRDTAEPPATKPTNPPSPPGQNA